MVRERTEGEKRRTTATPLEASVVVTKHGVQVKLALDLLAVAVADDDGGEIKSTTRSQHRLGG